MSPELPVPLRLGAFTELVGLRLTMVTPQRVEGHLDVGPRLHQPEGIVHGGVWTTVVETAGSMGGSAAAAERGLGVVGVHNSTELIRPVQSGRVHVVAEPLHQGRTQQLWDVQIRDGEGRLVAVGRLRLQHVDRRP